MKNSKKKVLHSFLTLLVCISMLVGSTFAWFTDNVSSGNNIITSGNLDVEMYWTDTLNGNETVWTNVEESDTGVFVSDNWEPGYTEVKYLKVVNKGDLAFKYQLNMLSMGEVGKLAEVIDVYYAQLEKGTTTSPFATRLDVNANMIKSDLVLADMANNNVTFNEGIILPATAEEDTFYCGETIIAVALHMQTTAGNEYQTQSIGDGFSIQALATQFEYESDSFGKDYDSGAFFPKTYLPVSISKDVTKITDGLNELTKQVEINGPYGVKVTLDAFTKLDGTGLVTLKISEKQNSDANVKVGENEELKAFDVHVEGLAADNTVPMVVEVGKVLPTGLNKGNLTIYHVENNNSVKMKEVSSKADFLEHNQFVYDPATGALTLYMATFSEVAVVSDKTGAWEGNFDYSWYDSSKTELTIANADQLAAFGAIVGGMNGQTKNNFEGKFIKLTADINLADEEDHNDEKKIFYPIGYYNSTGSYEKTSGGSITSNVSSFSGTFDGNGHTISNFYQNTWEMFGDYNSGYSGTPNHYKDAMGLFGYVNGGTVKNLTVDNFSSDGEFTPTGVIAAYVDGNSTFENIAITNCNPRVYNTGNGGIIGIAGDTSAANDDHITLKNITVDNSNTISALWGSWDVACGGLVGMYRGNVDGTGNATGDTISFTNCHVAAQIDVYNDVCANYQYYAYRYAGMIIGSVRHNTTNAEGKTIPNMTGISASSCTVNYGDWNDYYYCEFEKNSMASYSEDYQFSRIPHSELNFTDSNGNGVVDADERASVTGCKHNHTAEENHQAVYLPFHQLFTGYSWGVSSIGLEELEGIKNITVTIGKEESVEKFDTKFTGNFLYRVGNQNTVSLGSLFAAKDGASINDSGVVVTINAIDENTNVSGTFIVNTTDWTKGTIQFSGTGVVRVTIQDYNFCTPTELTLEVVDAVNATGATNATSNNVVLLNDCRFGSLEVSGGYTLFGNGFTMTCSSDSVASDLGYSFVTLNNGTLDNVQIVCPNFDFAALYKSNLTSSENRSETDSTGKTRYYNSRSGVMASGNSKILNSRISGGRAAVNVTGGNVLIDNSRIELGAVASIFVGSANSLTLKDVTLVQKPTKSTYDTSKTLMGFSVLVVCDGSGNSTPINLEGTFVQNAWANESDKKYVPTDGQSIIKEVLSKTEYLHDIDGDGINESVNLGIAYMPETITSKVNTTTINDERTDKNAVPYEIVGVDIMNGQTYVYSYKNTNGTDEKYKNETGYAPDSYGDIISLTYLDEKDGLVLNDIYEIDKWIYQLNVDLDKLNEYKLDFSKLSMSINGVKVDNFKVDGNDKPSSSVSIVTGGTTYMITATQNNVEYTAYFKVIGTETTKESPSLIASNYSPAILVGEAGSTFTKDTWHGAAPVLEGIQIKYWSVAEKQYKTINLSEYTPTTSGQQNGTNNTWTFTPSNNDFTLTITGGQVHSNNKVDAMPVVFESKLYFVANDSNGLVNYGNDARTIPVTYSFKDNNGGDELSFAHTWSIECSNKDTAYDYSDFCKGSSTTFTIKSSNGNVCVTPDTLVTLANGTQKRIDELTYSDKLVAWNMFSGDYEETDIAYIINHGEGYVPVISLNFSDGTIVKIIGEHGFLDATTKAYEFINESNVDSYIGHYFVKYNDEKHKYVKLDSYSINNEYTGIYSVASLTCNNALANGMVSITPANNFDDSRRYFNFLKVGNNMAYDKTSLQKDIDKYGTFKYEDLSQYLTREEFEFFKAMNGHYYKIGVGKGQFTIEEMIGTMSHEDIVPRK